MGCGTSLPSNKSARFHSHATQDDSKPPVSVLKASPFKPMTSPFQRANSGASGAGFAPPPLSLSPALRGSLRHRPSSVSNKSVGSESRGALGGVNTDSDMPPHEFLTEDDLLDDMEDLDDLDDDEREDVLDYQDSMLAPGAPFGFLRNFSSARDRSNTGKASSNTFSTSLRSLSGRDRKSLGTSSNATTTTAGNADATPSKSKQAWRSMSGRDRSRLSLTSLRSFSGRDRRKPISLEAGGASLASTAPTVKITWAERKSFARPPPIDTLLNSDGSRKTYSLTRATSLMDAALRALQQQEEEEEAAQLAKSQLLDNQQQRLESVPEDTPLLTKSHVLEHVIVNEFTKCLKEIASLRKDGTPPLEPTQEGAPPPPIEPLPLGPPSSDEAAAPTSPDSATSPPPQPRVFLEGGDDDARVERSPNDEDEGSSPHRVSPRKAAPEPPTLFEMKSVLSVV